MSKGQPKIFIISGPSRVGKDAITRGLLQNRSLDLQKIVTATSRPQRPGEINGRHYYFMTPAEFEKKIQAGYFLEWAVLRGGRYFGTPVHEFDRVKTQNKNAIMNIDVQGTKHWAKIRDDIVRIFIKPDLIANIKKRMSEAGFSREQMRVRLGDMKRELKEAKCYDYVVVNQEGKLEETIKKVAEIIAAEIKGQQKDT